MKLTATLPGGRTRTLLWIKDWDFAWQEPYQFREFVSLPKGTRLDAVVRYDNSAANRRNPGRPPVRVTWGESSTDEMGAWRYTWSPRAARNCRGFNRRSPITFARPS